MIRRVDHPKILRALLFVSLFLLSQYRQNEKVREHEHYRNVKLWEVCDSKRKQCGRHKTDENWRRLGQGLAGHQESCGRGRSSWQGCGEGWRERRGAEGGKTAKSRRVT